MSTIKWQMAARAQKMNPSVIREILKVTEKPGIISFAGGLPSPKTFPIAAFAEACAQVLREDGQAALQYAASEGFAPLREMVAAMLPWDVDPSQVLITTGSQQGLDLVAKILIDAGSKVLVETPTYLGALQAFTPMEPEIVSVACDDEGVDLNDLVAKASGARFFYVLPNFQNPTGRTMSEARRAALSAEAARLGLPIVEDNPYGELWFDTPPPLPLTARNPDGCVYLGSFSKVLAPGLRLGFLVAPKSLYPKLLQAKQAADLHSPGFNQRMVAEVMKNSFLARHVPTIRALYKSQRDAMLAALAREMPDDVTWNQPAGGMFLWARLPAGMNAVELLPKALEKNVAFVPGAAFYANHADERSLRLSFVTASVQQINTGVAALAAAIAESRRVQNCTSRKGHAKPHAVSDDEGSPNEQGPRDWLCQTAGAAAPSGGSELREANERGGA
jgi:2-aminoadipate transaminase